MKRIGLALGVAGSWAVRRSRTTGNELRTTPLPGVSPKGEGLPALFGALRDTFGAGPARVYVALLPGLSQVRRLALPDLRDQERRDVMRRTLPRHFPHGNTPHAFGAEPVSPGVIAAVAPLDLVAALERAVAGVGWRLVAVQPAEAAWAAAAETAVRGATGVVVWLPDRVELLRVERGRVAALRRCPARLAGDDGIARFVREHRGPGVLEHPEEVAAAFAHRGRGPDIVADVTWSQGRRRARRASALMAAAAGILLLLAGAVEWWGATRELAALRAERRAHAEQVTRALEARERVATLLARYEVLVPDDGGPRRWSRVLADVAEHLPRTAYLTAFRATGDSLALEGVAREAGPVLEALRGAPPIAALRATAPIRRETRAGSQETIERFALAARLTSGQEQP